MYDYEAKNVEHYGDYTPPEYDVTKVKVPTVLVQGTQDWLATVKVSGHSIPCDINVVNRRGLLLIAIF